MKRIVLLILIAMALVPLAARRCDVDRNQAAMEKELTESYQHWAIHGDAESYQRYRAIRRQLEPSDDEPATAPSSRP